MRGKTRRLVKLVKLAQRGDREAILEIKRRANSKKDRHALAFVEQSSRNR